MKPIEVTGKKIGDALKEGLRILGTTIDKVEYKVISQGGLFKKAKISIALLEDEAGDSTQKPSFVEKSTSVHVKEAPQKPSPQSSQQPKDARPRPLGQGNEQSKDDRQKSFAQGEEKPRFQGEQKKSAPNQHKSDREYKDREYKSGSTGKFGANQKQGLRGEGKLRKSNSDSLSEPRPPKNYETKKRVRTQEVSEDDVKRVADFAKELITRMGYESEVKTSIVDGDIVVDIVNESGALIGYRGETLDAIEYLASIQANREVGEYINIVVDSCGYRKKREKMLVSMAEHAANRCIKMGRKVIMEPMNRSSRKIVHSTLSKYDNIFTKSEGNEPNRHIVLFFKREKLNQDKQP